MLLGFCLLGHIVRKVIGSVASNFSSVNRNTASPLTSDLVSPFAAALSPLLARFRASPVHHEPI
jgi:hypothetical protein